MPISEADIETFADRFAAAWDAPTADRLAALLTDDVVLIQPLGATARGKPAAREGLARSLRFIPDLRAEVLQHWSEGDRVAIEFDLVGTVGGRPLRWRVVDVIELRDGLVAQRRANFNPLPLLAAVITRPRAWLPYLRSGMWRRS